MKSFKEFISERNDEMKILVKDLIDKKVDYRDFNNRVKDAERQTGKDFDWKVVPQAYIKKICDSQDYLEYSGQKLGKGLTNESIKSDLEKFLDSKFSEWTYNGKTKTMSNQIIKGLKGKSKLSKQFIVGEYGIMNAKNDKVVIPYNNEDMERDMLGAGYYQLEGN